MYLFLPLTKASSLMWPHFFANRVALLERDYCSSYVNMTSMARIWEQIQDSSPLIKVIFQTQVHSHDGRNAEVDFQKLPIPNSLCLYSTSNQSSCTKPFPYNQKASSMSGIIQMGLLFSQDLPILNR